MLLEVNIPIYYHPLRHGRVRLLREDGAYFGKNDEGVVPLRSLCALAVNDHSHIEESMQTGIFTTAIPTRNEYEQFQE
jgi:hypothetical protein